MNLYIKVQYLPFVCTPQLYQYSLLASNGTCDMFMCTPQLCQSLLHLLCPIKYFLAPCLYAPHKLAFCFFCLLLNTFMLCVNVHPTTLLVLFYLLCIIKRLWLTVHVHPTILQMYLFILTIKSFVRLTFLLGLPFSTRCLCGYELWLKSPLWFLDE